MYDVISLLTYLQTREAFLEAICRHGCGDRRACLTHSISTFFVNIFIYSDNTVAELSEATMFPYAIITIIIIIAIMMKPKIERHVYAMYTVFHAMSNYVRNFDVKNY